MLRQLAASLKRGLRIGLAVALPLMALPAGAQDSYPSRPITLVVPFGAGSGTDNITRIVIEHMAKGLKTPIVVDNKAGASGQIGTEFVSRAAPDGYTLLVATNSTHSASPYLYKSLRYNPVSGFTPIGRMTINPLALLVRQDSPFKTVPDLLKFARDNPRKLSYGYGNTGGQVSAALLVNLGKFDALAVPYKTTPQAFTDLIGGQIDFTFVDIAASQSLIESGKIRALGVTSTVRYPSLAQVPALREVRGLEDFALYAWLGLMAPAGTPRPIVARLNAELRSALEAPEVKHALEQRAGSIVEATTADEFTAFLKEQSALWKQRIAEAGIQPE